MKRVIFMIALLLLLQSCATVLGGKKTAYQTQQQKGETKKQVRAGYIIADIIFFVPFLIVDFATGKIYKPEPKK